MIEEQPYDLRHNTPPRREGGPMDRLAEVPSTDQWGAPWNPGKLTTKEFEVVLNPDEDLETVVEEFIASAETEMTGLHPLMWKRIKSTGIWPRVQVQGEQARVVAFEKELASQPAQDRLTANGWIKRYRDDFRVDFEWLRVIWLPSSEPTPRTCDMPGCETTGRQRWAIAYRVPTRGAHAPVDRELFVYCESTVKADNDVASFHEEGK